LDQEGAIINRPVRDDTWVARIRPVVINRAVRYGTYVTRQRYIPPVLYLKAQKFPVHLYPATKM
jgi:hypothetical protein